MNETHKFKVREFMSENFKLMHSMNEMVSAGKEIHGVLFTMILIV